jgi:hypothetical protein
MIKTIYKKRIISLKKEYSKLEESAIKKRAVVEEYLSIKDDILLEIENITKNGNIEPNVKYIEIDKKIKYVETVMSKISEIQIIIKNEINKLDKERDIIISSCIEEYSDIDREKVLIEFDKLFKK